MSKTYSYSKEGEMFTGEYNTVAEAIKAAVVDELMLEGEEIYIGENESKSIMDYFNFDHLVDCMREAASDDVGEHAENWLLEFQEGSLGFRGQKAVRELESFVDLWATVNHLQPTFWGVVNITKHVI